MTFFGRQTLRRFAIRVKLPGAGFHALPAKWWRKNGGQIPVFAKLGNNQGLTGMALTQAVT